MTIRLYLTVRDLFHDLASQLEELAKQVAKQAEALTALQARQAKNSHNSSKPPSSDGYKKAATAHPHGGHAHSGDARRSVQCSVAALPGLTGSGTQGRGSGSCRAYLTLLP